MEQSRSAQFAAVDVTHLAEMRQGIATFVGAEASPATLADVALLATEVVSNVLLHIGSTATTCVGCGLTSVRVTVQDSGGGRVELMPKDGSRVGGNGLRIVDELAASWGSVEHAGYGKSVWFAVAIAVAPAIEGG